MPYITESEKAMVDSIGPATPGQLNYALTKVAMDYLKIIGPEHYSHQAEVLAALEGAKLEFYRRVMAPHEDRKMAENGDVYDA